MKQFSINHSQVEIMGPTVLDSQRVIRNCRLDEMDAAVLDALEMGGQLIKGNWTITRVED